MLFSNEKRKISRKIGFCSSKKTQNLNPYSTTTHLLFADKDGCLPLSMLMLVLMIKSIWLFEVSHSISQQRDRSLFYVMILLVAIVIVPVICGSVRCVYFRIISDAFLFCFYLMMKILSINLKICSKLIATNCFISFRFSNEEKKRKILPFFTQTETNIHVSR